MTLFAAELNLPASSPDMESIISQYKWTISGDKVIVSNSASRQSKQNSDKVSFARK